jgi:hypothetical protein
MALKKSSKPTWAKRKSKKYSDTPIPAILWRQLEFGTGVQGKGPAVQSAYSFGDGSWGYPTVTAGVRIAGSMPANIFRTASMAPYTGDATSFRNYFLMKFVQALRGI